MWINAIGIGLGMIAASACWSQPPPRIAPDVVYRGAESIPTQPYIARVLQGRDGASVPELPMSEGVRPLEDALPLAPSPLVPGAPHYVLREGMIRPLFIMGMDPQSLDWLVGASLALAALGAQGLVVEASDRQDWLALQAAASEAGIPLSLFRADSLADLYAVTTYPVLVLSPTHAALLEDAPVERAP
jgi:integrating conjugative element protein (TIGR03765 family)